MSIPLIDVSPLFGDGGEESKREVATRIRHACEEVGFFSVVGHPVPPELIREFLSITREFFVGLTPDDKCAIHIDAHSCRGYQRVGENVTKGVRDQHEAIDFFRELSSADVSPQLFEGFGGADALRSHLFSLHPLKRGGVPQGSPDQHVF